MVYWIEDFTYSRSKRVLQRHTLMGGRWQAGLGKSSLSEEGIVTEEIDIRMAHWLPGKPAEEHNPHCPFDKPPL